MLRVATDLSLPPYGMMDATLQPTGSDVETGKQLAAALGVKYELVSTTASARIPTLQTGKADVIISSLAILPQRKEVLDFSDIYSVLRTVVAGPKSVKVNTLTDLNGKTVGLVRATTQDTFLTNNAKEVRIVRYEDEATAAQAYLSGQVDFVSTAEMSIPAIAQRTTTRQPEVKLVLTTSLLGIGMRKGEPRLLEETNRWVRANLANGNLNAIYKKYEGIDLPEDVIKGTAN